jgi:hypothetical protein
MVLNPRHRWNCAGFFAAPHQTAHIDLAGPRSAINELEHAAARAGRTWNDQLNYILELFRGYRPPDFDDERSVEDWRTFMSPWKFRADETDDWSPFTCLWRKTP